MNRMEYLVSKCCDFAWDCCEKARREENPVIKDMYISFAEDWIGRAEKFLEDVE